MKTFAIAALAFVATTLSIGIAHAQAPSFYVATPVAAPTQSSLVTRSVSWRAQGTSYVAVQAPERAAILCRLIADRVGPLATFSAAGRPVDADALATCNARAAAKATTVAVK